MNSKHVEILKKFAESVLKTPPEITLANAGDDEPVILIGNEFTIYDSEIDKPTLKGKIKLQGFGLSANLCSPATQDQPEDYDYAEIFFDTDFLNVAHDAIKEYAGLQLRHLLEVEHCDALAKDLEEGRKMDQSAYNEGHVAYKEDEQDNPYPYGTSMYYKWIQGRRDAENFMGEIKRGQAD